MKHTKIALTLLFFFMPQSWSMKLTPEQEQQATRTINGAQENWLWLIYQEEKTYAIQALGETLYDISKQPNNKFLTILGDYLATKDNFKTLRTQILRFVIHQNKYLPPKIFEDEYFHKALSLCLISLGRSALDTTMHSLMINWSKKVVLPEHQHWFWLDLLNCTLAPHNGYLDQETHKKTIKALLQLKVDKQTFGKFVRPLQERKKNEINKTLNRFLSEKSIPEYAKKLYMRAAIKYDLCAGNPPF